MIENITLGLLIITVGMAFWAVVFRKPKADKAIKEQSQESGFTGGFIGETLSPSNAGEVLKELDNSIPLCDDVNGPHHEPGRYTAFYDGQEIGMSNTDTKNAKQVTTTTAKYTPEQIEKANLDARLQISNEQLRNQCREAAEHDVWYSQHFGSEMGVDITFSNGSKVTHKPPPTDEVLYALTKCGIHYTPHQIMTLEGCKSCNKQSKCLVATSEVKLKEEDKSIKKQIDEISTACPTKDEIEIR